MFKPQPYKLKNTIQHYDWGTKGKNAFIPKFLNIKTEKDKPYAELWMGVHPKASSKIIVDGKEIDLAEVIRQHPIEMLGSKTAKKFSNTLPFLFKVLSAGEALSIQVHPSRRQAISLHKKDPVNYPDDNQKLEIAIAVDSLTALVGFKPFDQIINILKEYPEIGAFIGEKLFVKTIEMVDKQNFDKILSGINPADNGNNHQHLNRFIGLPVKAFPIKLQKKFVKRISTHLIKKSVSDANGLNAAIQKLNHRITKKKIKTEIEKYFLELHKKYKNDVGLLILFFLNLVHLKKGEAIFTKPGIFHAYLTGNILECMSNSDNVIRAGLTPKHKDIDSLLKVLKYELSLPKIIRGKKQRNSLVYQTEAKEFQLKIYSLNRGKLKFKNQSGPRILLVLNGSIHIVFNEKNGVRANKYSKGESVFLPSILSDYKLTAERSASLAVAAMP